MDKKLDKYLTGYKKFRDKYASKDTQLMQQLAEEGQNPPIMMVTCSDSRVDPAIILQCDPGDLFMCRNVANIIPAYEPEQSDSTGAALEYGVCYLNVSHLIIMGHSQCGGIQALKDHTLVAKQDDFISDWVAKLKLSDTSSPVDKLVQQALLHSYQNCLSFPWINKRVADGTLHIHLWFFDIASSELYAYSEQQHEFQPLIT